LKALGFTTCHVGAPLKRGGKNLERAIPVAKVEVVRKRNRIAIDIDSPAVDLYQSRRVGEWQRTHEDGVDEAENGGVRANGERREEDGGCRKRKTGAKCAPRLTEFVASHGHLPC
jgi:hypothetical protein